MWCADIESNMNDSDPKLNIVNKIPKRTLDIVSQGLAKRYKAERRFKLYGLAAIILSLLFLSLLFVSIIGNGYTAFQQTFIQLDVFFDPEILDREALVSANYTGLVKKSLRTMFPGVEGRRDKRLLYGLISSGTSFQIRDIVLSNPEVIGKTLPVWVPAADDVDMLIKGHSKREAPEGARRLKDKQLSWIDRLGSEDRIQKKFNTNSQALCHS